jgi:hypothetical protein
MSEGQHSQGHAEPLLKNVDFLFLVLFCFGGIGI